MKFLNVPHYSQLDNEFHPTDTCNLTSAAMCLAYHGIKPKQRVQLEGQEPQPEGMRLEREI